MKAALEFVAALTGVQCMELQDLDDGMLRTLGLHGTPAAARLLAERQRERVRVRAMQLGFPVL